MNKRKPSRLRLWQLGIVAVAMGSILAVTTGAANAAGPVWVPDQEGGQAIRTAGTAAYAELPDRTSGQIWRADNGTGSMLISINHGPRVTLPGNSDFSPVIAPTPGGGFMIAHLGQDHRIYYGYYYGSGSSQFTGWRPTGTAADGPPSITQIGDTSNYYMVWRGNSPGRPDGVWGSYFDSAIGNWGPAQQVGATPALTYDSPSVTWNQSTNTIHVAHTGIPSATPTSQSVFISVQAYGSSTWSPWRSVGAPRPYYGAEGSPTLASTSGSNVEVGVRDIDGYFYYLQYAPTTTGSWYHDDENWQTPYNVYLARVQNVIWAIMTGQNHQVYIKQF
jgi:hypothetical protein